MRLLDPDNDNKDQPTIKLMLELEPLDALRIAKALHLQGMKIGESFNEKEAQMLRETAQVIISRHKDQDIDYTGRHYDIWTRGKRRLHLGFKREEDIYLGMDLGRNFLEACHHYFTCVQYTGGAYNITKNTLSGYQLYCPSDGV